MSPCWSPGDPHALQNEVSFSETGIQGPQLESRQTSCSISWTLFPFFPLQWTQLLILPKQACREHVPVFCGRADHYTFSLVIGSLLYKLTLKSMNTNSNTCLALISLNYLRSGGTFGWGCYVRCVLPWVSSQRHVPWNHTGIFKLANTTKKGRGYRSGFPALEGKLHSQQLALPTPFSSEVYPPLLFPLWFSSPPSPLVL